MTSEAKRKQVAEQCKAVAHMATALAQVHTDYANSVVPISGDEHVEQVGKRTAAFMETLGDMLNGMDAVDSSDDWMKPVFAGAHRLWPVKSLRDELYRIVQHHEIARGGEMYTNDTDLANSIAGIARDALAR